MKSWIDRNKRQIYLDDYLIDDVGQKFKVLSIDNKRLSLLRQSDGSLIKISKSQCRSPYDSIDLKNNECQLINYRIYK